jgi:chromosome segregation ATPase
MFRSKLFLVAIAAVLLAFGGLALSAKNAHDDVELLTLQVEQLKAERATKQAEVDTLANAVELVSFSNQQLLAERKSIEAIRAQADAEKARLRAELNSANAQVAKLRVSTDEHVKNWANTVMPADAVRLLKYATARGDNQNSNGNQSGIPDTTSRILAQLPTGYRF